MSSNQGWELAGWTNTHTEHTAHFVSCVTMGNNRFSTWFQCVACDDWAAVYWVSAICLQQQHHHPACWLEWPEGVLLHNLNEQPVKSDSAAVTVSGFAVKMQKYCSKRYWMFKPVNCSWRVLIKQCRGHLWSSARLFTGFYFILFFDLFLLFTGALLSFLFQKSELRL